MAAIEPMLRPDMLTNMERYVCDGNDAVEFRLVRSRKDLEDSCVGFHPEMCHQVFNEQESIFGYENLKINVFLTSGSLKTYMDIKYDRKISMAMSEGLKPDDIESKMKDVLRGGFTRNMDEFSAAIEKEEKSFKPTGELIHCFNRKFVKKVNSEDNANGNATNGSSNSHANGDSQLNSIERTFEIYMVDATTNPKFMDYLKRMETFLLFFIDAGSFVDCEDDEKWKFFVMFEKYKTSEGNQAYAFAGYSSVYQFYAYPDGIRPRVAQMLVLPPFQRQGLAPELLSTVYSHYRTNPLVKEITVEDPSDEFERLRDFVDARDCKKLVSYSKQNLKKGFSTEMAEEAHRVLKMTKRQAHRVYEILRLQVTNIHDERDFKEFRLDVKKRLNIPYQKQQSDIKRLASRKCFTEDLQKATALDDQTRKTELESNFKLVLTHYQEVLARLERHC